jgi:hypothetical protein
MFPNALGTGSFAVDVATSENGGHPPEFWAQQAVTQIISIGDTTDPAISAQARAFRDKIEQVILFSINKAIDCDRTTVGYILTQAGQPSLAQAISRRP